MMEFQKTAGFYSDPERMASDFLKQYFVDGNIVFPINPFQMLTDEGILFLIKPFKKLEGVYLPATEETDVPIVGINLNRPITRQRFTAVHELCHHYRDANKQFACPFNKSSQIEIFAENFAAAVLMPLDELRRQVALRQHNGYVDNNAVLEIADYFGVSFESCIHRIAYKLRAIEGDTKHSELLKRIRKYKPDKKREELNMSYSGLYEDLIDSYKDALAFSPNEYARYVFQNEYVYNDSRLEGVDISLDQAAEIVTDLRLHKQNSNYCIEENEAFMSIAGHFSMYQSIFEIPVKETCSVFDTVGLNTKLYSCYPCPEFGGNFRQSDTLVLGAKFETTHFEEIIPELLKLESDLKAWFPARGSMKISEYIENAIVLHHKLTVVHPFADGNGRTLRAFLNMQLVRNGISPLYIKVEEKQAYFHALEIADTTGNYHPLFELIFKVLLRSCSELSRVNI